MLTIIDNPDAPTTYDYKVSAPDGGKIALTADGGAMIVAADGAVIASIATPWAHDATGNAITTYFTTDGRPVVQLEYCLENNEVCRFNSMAYWYKLFRLPRNYGAWRRGYGSAVNSCCREQKGSYDVCSWYSRMGTWHTSNQR